MAVDWEDPCARYAALRDAYYAVLSSGSETLIKYKGPEGEREVRCHAQDLSWLLKEMQAAQDQCAIKNNLSPPNRRFAIRAGTQRRHPLC
jgi:hypothetical protein